jgi:hypothetical protein
MLHVLQSHCLSRCKLQIDRTSTKNTRMWSVPYQQGGSPSNLIRWKQGNVNTHMNIKKFGLWGASHPHALYKRRSLTQTEKTLKTHAPPLHGGAITRVSAGQDLPFVLWCGGRLEDFFDPRLKSAPTGSRTHDLGRCYLRPLTKSARGSFAHIWILALVSIHQSGERQTDRTVGK